MSVDTTEKLFEHQLKDAYSAEKQILKALPKLIEKAQDEELKANLQMHLNETENQAKRLESIFETLDKKPQAHTCLAMKGILEEGDETLSATEPNLIDLAITASTARVEHYEMALYSGLVEIAAALDEDEALDLLKETLKEEEAAAKKVAAALKKGLKEAVALENEE